MKFIKLHENGDEVLVNMSNVSKVYTAADNKVWMLLNFAQGDYQVNITVDESLDEILELVDRYSNEVGEMNKPNESASSINQLMSLHGWGLRRATSNKIIVTNADGSGAVLNKNDKANSTTETIFYRMMDDFLQTK